MASSSNSRVKYSYDIFLSFRGLDTRKKFTDHLYEALKREGFQTFRDDDEIKKGENIKSELQKAIWNSRMSIIVFSENYAESTSCLFEIHTIIELHKRKADHHILPVFYEVDPRYIKDQAKKLDKMTGEEVDLGGKKVTCEEVKGWSAALKEVASMAGMVSGSQANGYEAKFIEEIIGVLKSKQAGDYLDLEENMLNLKKKVEYLRCQEIDINSAIGNAKRQPWKKPKKEVEVWLMDVQLLKDDVQRLEQEVVGEMDFLSHLQLGKDIIKKIQDVSELQEKLRNFGGLLIDEVLTGRLPLPSPKDFIISTKARNTENIWACLMNDCVRRIGVHGMGGIGKTTIMKHIHNQLLEEKGKFDSAYWVTVSKESHITKLQSGIAKALNLSLCEDDDVVRRASQLHAVLSRQERCVLILDDVWKPFALETVGIPEPETSKGCKLVLTTRSLEVCQRMGCTPVKVDLLTEEEGLTLFLTKAIGCDMELAQKVKEIATKIAKKCACLPLAIVSVAGSLQGLKGMSAWRNALDELTVSTKDVSNVESEVFECLKFSYSRLEDKVLQDCFLYCSLYPEDHEILAEELIDYWIAEEFIADRNSVEAKFDKGYVILQKLASASLLESYMNELGVVVHVRIHDLIRDMAHNIAACSTRFLVKSHLDSLSYEDWSEDLKRISLVQNYRLELPVRSIVFPRLTTLLLRNNKFSVIPDLFPFIPCLEVLDLSGNPIKSLPESVSNLVKLRAIILRNCRDLEYVPSLDKLKALKVFKLTYNWQIKEVPKGIEECADLRELDLFGNWGIETFPSRKLCKLSKLQCLNISNTKVEVSANDLMCLTQLKVVAGRLHNFLELTRYVTSPQFQGLEMYRLTTGNYLFKRLTTGNYLFKPLSRPRGKEVSITILFEPSGIGVDRLAVLPNDITFLELEGFHDVINLSTIPCLKDARHLRKFSVGFCDRLESIFLSSSFSADGQIPLCTIESICLNSLSNYRQLFDGIVPSLNISFNLKKLSVTCCESVEGIFPTQLLQNFPNLEDLEVAECDNVKDIIVGEEELSDTNTIVLPRLRILHLRRLPRLESIYSGIMVCKSLICIKIDRCPRLRRLPFFLHMDVEQATAPPFLDCIEGEEEWWEVIGGGEEWWESHC